MNSPIPSPDPVTIMSVSFGDRWLEIYWHDAMDSTARSMQFHQDNVDPNLVPDQLSDVLDTLRDILTVAAVERRDPPKSFTRGE